MFDRLVELEKKNRDISKKYAVKTFFILLLSILVALFELISISFIIPIVTFYTSDTVNNVQQGTIGVILKYLNLLFPINIVNLTIGFMIVTIFTAIGRIYLTYSMRIITNRIGNDLSIKLFNKFTGDDYSYHLRVDKSKIISGFSKIDYLMDGLLSPVLFSVSSFVMTFLIIIFLLFINIKLAIYSMGILAIIYVSISKVVNKKLIQNSGFISSLQTENYRIINNTLQSIKSIIINQSAPTFRSVYEKTDLKKRIAMAWNSVVGVIPKYLVEALGIIAMMFILLIQFKSDQGSGVALPYVAGILFAFQRMLPMVQTIYQSWTQIIGSDKIIKDILDIIEDKQNDFKIIKTISKERRVDFKNIEIKNVNYSYKNSKKIAINNINIKINENEKIAIIGESGAGKTTLLEVILSLLSPNEGSIYWDSTLVNQNNLYDYRKLFSYVSQDVFLLDDTIEKNIAFSISDEAIDSNKINDALQKTCLDLFIDQLPEKEKTIIGSNRMLSGGQQQRIGIARALYHDSPIIILDESTSNLDPETEYKILFSLTKNNPDKTIIMVTHKYDNLSLFDRVIKIQNGHLKL